MKRNRGRRDVSDLPLEVVLNRLEVELREPRSRWRLGRQLTVSGSLASSLSRRCCAVREKRRACAGRRRRRLPGRLVLLGRLDLHKIVALTAGGRRGACVGCVGFVASVACVAASTGVGGACACRALVQALLLPLVQAAVAHEKILSCVCGILGVLRPDAGVRCARTRVGGKWSVGVASVSRVVAGAARSVAGCRVCRCGRVVDGCRRSRRGKRRAAVGFVRPGGRGVARDERRKGVVCGVEGVGRGGRAEARVACGDRAHLARGQVEIVY